MNHNPPAPQGESSNWSVPTPPAASDTVSMAYPRTPSAPKAEQVPQDANLGKTVANMTRHAEHHIEQRDQQAPFTPSQRQEIRHKVEVEITALIVAERARFAAQQLETYTKTYLAMIDERDQLRRELEAERLNSQGWQRQAKIAGEQLAALQRENVELKMHVQILTPLIEDESDIKLTQSDLDRIEAGRKRFIAASNPNKAL